MEDVEHKALLFQLVDALPAEQRQVVLLRFGEQKSIRDISRELRKTEGAVKQSTLKIGDALMEMGEAHNVFQPMQSAFMLYVPDVDATYRRALAAGATSMSEPADSPIAPAPARLTMRLGIGGILRHR